MRRGCAEVTRGVTEDVLVRQGQAKLSRGDGAVDGDNRQRAPSLPFAGADAASSSRTASSGKGAVSTAAPPTTRVPPGRRRPLAGSNQVALTVGPASRSVSIVTALRSGIYTTA